MFTKFVVVISIIGAVATPFVIVALSYVDYMKKRKHRKKQEELYELERQKANNRFRIFGCPTDIDEYKYIRGYKFIPDSTWLYVWISENKMIFLEDGVHSKKYDLSIGNINYYTLKGDLKQITRLVGGNSSPIWTSMLEESMGTAVAMQDNQVVPVIQNVDDRMTIINATIEKEDSFIFFEDGNLYEYLLQNIPQKEQSFVAMNK